jgi:hypothetical protein
MNLFNRAHGSQLLYNPVIFFLYSLSIILLSVILPKLGVTGSMAIVAVPVISFFIAYLMASPYRCFITVFFINYFAMGINRYVPGPLGLTLDIFLLLTYLSIIFNNFYSKIDWNPAQNLLTLLAAVWFAYSLFELVNPEAHSRAAWFYAMRGMSLYMFLTIPLTFMLFNKIKDLRLFFILWGVFSILATLKGLVQYTIGVDPYEKQWLDNGGAVTHVLFGKLRIFSFFTDAGQFGGSQGQASIVYFILFIAEKNKKLKWFYGIVSILALISLLISGTRGALAVPVAGVFMYLLVSKNLKIIVSGLILMISSFLFLKYTTIGQDIYEIRRMRTALDPNNDSLKARLENQKRLKTYLASRPFGGGLGSAGNWGKRFSPNTFLANIPTDSWYVAIWAEQGFVGLFLHLIILITVLFKGIYITMVKLRNVEVKTKIQALLAGYFGIIIASYGNGLLGQMPTGIIIYMTMTFIFMSEKIEKELN